VHMVVLRPGPVPPGHNRDQLVDAEAVEAPDAVVDLVTPLAASNEAVTEYHVWDSSGTPVRHGRDTAAPATQADAEPLGVECEQPPRRGGVVPARDQALSRAARCRRPDEDAEQEAVGRVQRSTGVGDPHEAAGLGAAFLSPAYDVDGVLELDLLRARSVGTDVAVDQAHQLGAVLTGRRVGDVEGKRLPRRDARTRPVGIEPQSGPHSSTSSAAAQPSAHRRVTNTANSASFSGGIGGVLVDRRRHATTASQHTDVITGERLRARPQSLPCAGWWSRPPARPRSGARRPPRVCLQPRVPQPVPWPARHPVPCRRRRRSLRRAPSSVDLASAMSVIQQ